MQTSIAISIGLPVALVIIMLGLGLSLKFDDFTRVFTKPKPILVGILCQVLLLPLFCLGLVYFSDLPASIAVGMMLLAASPGGTSATIFTHLARGDVALSLMLAAVTSLLALVTIPIIANGSLMLFFGEANTVYLQISQVLQIFAVAIVPALVGVYIRSLYPAVCGAPGSPSQNIGDRLPGAGRHIRSREPVESGGAMGPGDRRDCSDLQCGEPGRRILRAAADGRGPKPDRRDRHVGQYPQRGAGHCARSERIHAEQCRNGDPAGALWRHCLYHRRRRGLAPQSRIGASGLALIPGCGTAWSCRTSIPVPRCGPWSLPSAPPGYPRSGPRRST